MEGDDVIYKRDVQVKIDSGQYKNKNIVILETIKGYKIKLLDNEDIFYWKTVSISQVDYGTNYKEEQSIMAGFSEFPGLVMEMLNKTVDPLSGFYLELTENPIATKLQFCEKTQLKRITHLELMFANEHIENIKKSVLCRIYSNKVDMQILENTKCALMDKIRHYEKIKELLNVENTYLVENQLHSKAQAIKLVLKNQQKIEELEKIYLERFHCHQKEKEEELKNLKITNSSLEAINRILETENTELKKKLKIESKKLISTFESKEEVDKDLKILKAKITRYTKELKQFHEQVPYLKKEICRLKESEEAVEKMEKSCLIAKKAFDNCSRKLKESENVLCDQVLKIQIMARTIENLKKEDMRTKAANTLLEKKLKMNSDVVVDLRNKLQSKHFELQNRKKTISKLENENKILRENILDLRHEIDFLIKRSPTHSDKDQEKEDLTTYLKDKYQMADIELSTKKFSDKCERDKFAKLSEDFEKRAFSDAPTS